MPATYVGGLLFLCIYYKVLHPGGRMPNPGHSAYILWTQELISSANISYTWEHRQFFKTSRRIFSLFFATKVQITSHLKWRLGSRTCSACSTFWLQQGVSATAWWTRKRTSLCSNPIFCGEDWVQWLEQCEARSYSEIRQTKWKCYSRCEEWSRWRPSCVKDRRGNERLRECSHAMVTSVKSHNKECL